MEHRPIPTGCTSLTQSTVVPGFSVLGFRALPGFKALNAGNQIWFYAIDLPGSSALPGFKAPFYGDGQSVLNPGTTVFVPQPCESFPLYHRFIILNRSREILKHLALQIISDLMSF